MKTPRSKTPPSTLNAEAQTLIDAAVNRCDGCRTNWRVNARTSRHGAGGPFCTAQVERKKLRDIAAKMRGK